MAITEAWQEQFYGRNRPVRRTVEWWPEVDPPYFKVMDFDRNRWCIMIRRCDFEDLPLDLAVAAVAKRYECYGAIDVPMEVCPL